MLFRSRLMEEYKVSLDYTIVYSTSHYLSQSLHAYLLWSGRRYAIHILVVLGWNCYITTMHTCYFIGGSSGSNGINFGLEKETRWKVGTQFFFCQGWNY